MFRIKHIRTNILGMLDSWRRHPGIFAVTVISVSAIAVALVSLFSARAAGPFTISPAQGLYTGGDTITITGNGFGDPALKFTSESYIGKEDLMVQLDAIQNQRGTPVAPATNSGASINITDNSSSYYWHDLACDRTTNSITYTNVYANTTCEDFLFWSTSGNPATWVRTSNGGPIVLHFTGNQVAKMVNTFNMGTTGVTPPTPPGGGNGLWNATDGTARSKMTTEISVKQNAATTTAAAVLFEFGAAYNSNPGYRMILGASTNSAATPTYNGGNCYGSTGNNIRTGTWTCANDTNWKNFAGIFTRSTASANGYTNTYWLNGSLAVTSSTSTTALAAPNSADFFIGARSMTSGSTGTARFNGDIRSYRMYRRTLTEQELKCNMWVDQARYEGTAISGTNIDGCKTGASNISGTGITFFNAPTVTIGGQTCTVKDYTATSITCVTPANAPGQYNVVVTPAAATGLPVQTYPNGFRYTSDLFEYDIQNTGVSPYTYRIDPSTLRLSLSYTHAALITISYPRTASDNSATVMTRGVTMANSTVTTVVGGQCGGVACMTTSISITGSAANINGANGLENFLKGLQWSGGGGYLRGEIRISIMPEDVVFWIDGDGNKHFYQLLNGGSNFSWTDAYNFAKTKTFHGLTGYLMSMVNQDEADLIKTYIQNSGTTVNGYTAGIRFRVKDTSNPTAHAKVDGTIGYNGDTRTMPNLPTGGAGTISGHTSLTYQEGFECTDSRQNPGSSQGCDTLVAARPRTLNGATCATAAAYDTEWYWANPVDLGAGFFMGRAGGSNGIAECTDDPMNATWTTNPWNGAQPQGGEPIMTYNATSGTSTFGWHDYTNNTGSGWVYVEYSEGWENRGGGTYDMGTVTNWIAPIPLSITIHHVRASNGETLAPDTKAPSMGLNTTTNQFQCNAGNGGQVMVGYVWTSSSCLNGLFPYNPALQSGQEITYTYAHQTISDPVPFKMQRTTVGSNYVYVMYPGDANTALDDFGPIRQVVITYPSALAFTHSLPGGWTVVLGSGTATISIPATATPTEVQNYLYTIRLTASGLTNVTGSVTVQVADYANVPSSGDPGRTSLSAVLPQPIIAHHYRLGQTTELSTVIETIGMFNATYTVPSPPSPINYNGTDYAFYQSSPTVGYLMTYSGTLQHIYYYYQPMGGYTVTFSMNGETAAVSTPPQTVPGGDYAVRPPDNPVVLGKSFINWYTTSGCTTTFNFSGTQINNDQTVYACFQVESPMTVIFNTASPAGSPVVNVSPTQIANITYNDFIIAPSPPILPGYSFSSWNTEPMSNAATCAGEVWDFLSDRVELETNTPTGASQMTLYVCWQPQSPVTIQFNTATNAPATIQVLPSPASDTVPYNSIATAPAPPVSEGYAFTSWNTAAMTNATTCGGSPFNFSTRLTTLTPVYACWTKMSNLTITFQKTSFETTSPGTGIVGWPVNVNDMPYNSAAASYEPAPTLSGYRLSHWCLAATPNCARADRFDWAVRRTANMVLVAVWRLDQITIDEVVPSYGPTTGGNRVTIYGSGFMSYDASSYSQNGLMVLLDGENNAGSLATPSHSSSSTTWNNLVTSNPRFGNFTLTGATINSDNISFSSSASPNPSRAVSTAGADLGGTTIIPNNGWMTVETAYRQNQAENANITQLWNYGPLGWGNTGANNTFGESLHVNNTNSTYTSGSCFFGRRTNATTYAGIAGSCSNNTSQTTHSVTFSKQSSSAQTLFVNGTQAATNTNGAAFLGAAAYMTLGARNTTSSTTNAPSSFSNHANVSIGSFRMYNRQLTSQEMLCNYYVDLARFSGIYDSALMANCTSLSPNPLHPISPTTITINGQACTAPSVTNDTIMSCVAPASTLPGNGEGSVNVYVANSTKNASLANGYTYRAPLTIATVSPPSGSQYGGDTITITGNNFIPPSIYSSPSYTVTLDIGGTPANCVNVTVVDNNTITCTVSAHSSGPGLVSVTVNNSAESYTMAANPDPLSIQGMPILDGQGRSLGGFFYTIDPYLEVSASNSPVNLTVSPSTPFNGNYITVGVATNNPTGYTLTIRSNGANLVCSENTTFTIPPTVGNTVDSGTWGFQVGLSTSTSGWLPTPTTPATIATSNSPTFVPPSAPAAANTRVNFAVRDGSPRPLAPCSGYKQNVIYTAVANT